MGHRLIDSAAGTPRGTRLHACPSAMSGGAAAAPLRGVFKIRTIFFVIFTISLLFRVDIPKFVE